MMGLALWPWLNRLEKDSGHSLTRGGSLSDLLYEMGGGGNKKEK